MTEKAPTHNAYALKRDSRIRGRMIEIGHARIESDGTAVHRVVLDRLPTGGFTGDVFLYPVGIKPTDPDPQPERPD
jgi:hypothetical protein